MTSSHNRNTINGYNKEIPTEKEIITSNNGENHKLHGDWLLVTRRKKPQNHSTLNDSKTITQKGNRFNVLSALAHQPNTSTANKKFSPRPKTNEASHGNNSHYETKRRRQEDHYFVPTTKQLLPDPISNSKIPTDIESSHALLDTSATQTPLPDPHKHDHVHQATSPENLSNPNKPTLTKSTNLSPSIQHNMLAQDKTILVPTSQYDMNEDSDDGIDKNASIQEPPTLCEEDMIT